MASSRDPLGNAVRILRYLAESSQAELGVRELANATGIHPSTVSRLLVAMRRHRLVARVESSGAYAPHPELIRLGLLTSRKQKIKEHARPHIEALRDRFEESVFVAIYDPVERQLFRVDSVASPHPLRYVVELDRWTDVFRGASGLGVLAFLPSAEREEVLARAEAAGVREDNPRLFRSYLAPVLDEIRARGYALTHGHRIPGAVGISAPIRNVEGRVIGDIIMTVPEVRFVPEQEQALAAAIVATAERVTCAISGEVTDQGPDGAAAARPDTVTRA